MNLALFLQKLGLKEAVLFVKQNNPTFTLNSLFKQVYSQGIKDLIPSSSSSLFGIDPMTYNTWKSNARSKKNS